MRLETHENDVASIESGLINNDGVIDHHLYKKKLEDMVLSQYLYAIKTEKELGIEYHSGTGKSVHKMNSKDKVKFAGQRHNHNSRVTVSRNKDHKFRRSMSHVQKSRRGMSEVASKVKITRTKILKTTVSPVSMTEKRDYFTPAAEMLQPKSPTEDILLLLAFLIFGSLFAILSLIITINFCR